VKKALIQQSEGGIPVKIDNPRLSGVGREKKVIV
jgi:hypothetical protein